MREGACDVAVGSRFVSGDGYQAYRVSAEPRATPSVLRCSDAGMKLALRRPFADATSGLYAVNAAALPLLAEPFRTEAPEVEALLRLSDAGLRSRKCP